MGANDLKSALRAFASGGRVNALARWITSAIPPDNDIYKSLRQLRARSREASQNDDHQRQYLRLLETNVIGKNGIDVHSTVPNNDRLNQRIDAAYDLQSKRGNWDVTGQYSRSAFARLAIRTVAQDGEVLIRIHSDDRFAVELIDAECLDIDYNDDRLNVRMGIQFDEYRKPITYHVFSEPRPWGTYQSGRGTERIPIPASEMLHVYLPEWVWQSRGVPWTSTALARMKMLRGYEEAAITAARGSAVKSVVYKQSLDAIPGSSPSGEQAGNHIVQDLEAGMNEILPPGWDVQGIDWNWPNTSHSDFEKAALRGIAAGLGVSYNSLANDLEGVNYTSLRHGAITDRDHWMTLQGWWIEWAEEPIRNAWVEWASVNGVVGTPGSISLPELFRANYLGRRWQWVDPLKDIDALEKAIKLRVKSWSESIREQGRNPEEVWEELAWDITRMEELGLNDEATEDAG